MQFATAGTLSGMILDSSLAAIRLVALVEGRKTVLLSRRLTDLSHVSIFQGLAKALVVQNMDAGSPCGNTTVSANMHLPR